MLNFRLISMTYKIILVFISLQFIDNTHAERLVVHDNEQQAMYILLKSLNIKEDVFVSNRVEKDVEKYKSYFDMGKRYYQQFSNGSEVSVITDTEGYVAKLVVINSRLTNLNLILPFKRTKILKLNSSEEISFLNIERLSKLEELKIVGNGLGFDGVLDFSSIRNLPSLRRISCSGTFDLRVDSMRGLTELENFECELSNLYSLKSFKNFRKLKTLKVRVKSSDLNYLVNLGDLETLEIGGVALKNVNAINSMPKLKHLKISDSSVKEINLDGTTKDLEYVRIVDTPIKDLPSFHLFKQLKNLSITGTEISVADSIYDLPKLERLVLARNLELKTVKSLKNLPKLKELKAYNGGVDEFSTGLLPNLEELTLSKTNITNLPPFHNYPNLRELYLKETKIKSLKGVEVASNLYRVYTDYDVMKAPENAKLLRELRNNRFKWMKNKTKE